jgi:hypothetical protein
MRSKKRPADPSPPETPEFWEDLLSGSVVREVMEADGVDPIELETMLRRLAADRTRRGDLPEA